MSLVRVEEPRVDMKENNAHVVKQGGQTYLYETLNANSYSTSQSRFDYTPASTSTILDRRLLIRQEVEFTFDEPVEIGVNDAPRALPLSSAMADVALQLNGTKITTQPEQYIHAFRRYGNDEEDRKKYLSTTPAMPDTWQDYAQWASVDGSGGSNKNPLAGFGEVYEPSRGGFRFKSLSVDKKTATYIFTEPIFISPLQFDERNEKGLTNLSKLILNIRWSDRLADRMWSHSSLGQPISSVSVAFPSATQLLITAITPNLLEPPSAVVNYAYLEPQTFIRNVAPLASGGKATIQSDSIKLAQVPDKVLLFCRRSRATSTFQTTDTFAKINRATIYVNNRVVMGGATVEQLYHIARKNGYNGDYATFSNYGGSPLMIDLSNDVGLADTLAPNCRVQMSLRVELDIENTAPNPVEYEFYLVVILGGLVSISENGMINTLGSLSQEAVLESRTLPTANYNEVMVMHGGGFFSGLKHFINKASRAVQAVAPYAKTVADVVAPELVPLIDSASAFAGQVRRHTGGSMASGRAGRRALLRR